MQNATEPGIEPGTLRLKDNHEAHYTTKATTDSLIKEYLLYGAPTFK